MEVFMIKLLDVLSGQIGTTGHGGFPRLVISESLAPYTAIQQLLADWQSYDDNIKNSKILKTGCPRFVSLLTKKLHLIWEPWLKNHRLKVGRDPQRSPVWPPKSSRLHWSRLHRALPRLSSDTFKDDDSLCQAIPMVFCFSSHLVGIWYCSLLSLLYTAIRLPCQVFSS